MENNNILHAGSKNLSTENWKVYHPSGRHMFTCGEKKAYWYLERNLAETVNGERGIKLTFEPKGNGFEDDEEFGRSSRIVQCVVTGFSEGLQRHHIVPYCYRTYFPEKYKSKNHHDVVLINFEIHSEYEQKANEFKDEIAKIYNVKTITELNAEYTLKLRELGKPNAMIMNTIHSLFKTYGRLSREAILEKLQYIAENTGIPFETLKGYNYIQFYKLYLLLRDDHINELYQFKIDYRKLYDHGYHVAQKLDTEEKIEEFVKLWRNHFVDTMQPLFMPNGWSVDFRIKTKI
jgi:hypothetical protein